MSSTSDPANRPPGRPANRPTPDARPQGSGGHRHTPPPKRAPIWGQDTGPEATIPKGDRGEADTQPLPVVGDSGMGGRLGKRGSIGQGRLGEAAGRAGVALRAEPTTKSLQKLVGQGGAASPPTGSTGPTGFTTPAPTPKTPKIPDVLAQATRRSPLSPAPTIWTPAPTTVLWLGGALILVNGAYGTGGLPKLWTLIWDPLHTRPANDPATIGAFRPVLGELVFLLVLFALASLSPTMARATVVFLLGVWAIWLTFNAPKLVQGSPLPHLIFPFQTQEAPEGAPTGKG